MCMVAPPFQILESKRNIKLAFVQKDADFSVASVGAIMPHHLWKFRNRMVLFKCIEATNYIVRCCYKWICFALFHHDSIIEYSRWKLIGRQNILHFSQFQNIFFEENSWVVKMKLLKKNPFTLQKRFKNLLIIFNDKNVEQRSIGIIDKSLNRLLFMYDWFSLPFQMMERHNKYLN